MNRMKYWWLWFIHKADIRIKNHRFYPQSNSNSEQKKIFQFSVLHNNWSLNPRGFWTVTKEEIYLHTYQDYKEARRAIFEYIEGWYNRKRIHGAIGYMTPQQKEDEELKKAA